MPAAEKRCVSSYAFSSCEIFMPSRFRQVNEVCLRRRKSRYTPGAKTAGPSPEKGDTGGAWILSAPNEENARRAECPPPCNSPASRRGADGSSFASYLLGGVSQWRTFVPAAKAASVHSCAHSAVRVGFPTPFLLGRHLAVFRPLRYPPHSILGHDSLSGPVSPQSHSYHTRFPRKSQRSAPCKTALYCRTAKNRRSGAESPCFAGKKDV